MCSFIIIKQHDRKLFSQASLYGALKTVKKTKKTIFAIPQYEYTRKTFASCRSARSILSPIVKESDKKSQKCWASEAYVNLIDRMRINEKINLAFAFLWSQSAFFRLRLRFVYD